MRKSRKLYFHGGVNGGKVGALRALDAAYRSYLQECIDFLLLSKRFSVPLVDPGESFQKNEKERS